jgi:hypothetical protein
MMMIRSSLSLKSIGNNDAIGMRSSVVLAEQRAAVLDHDIKIVGRRDYPTIFVIS